MNWISARKYQTLLVSLLALIFIYPVLGHSTEYRFLFDVLLSFVFLAALLVLFTDRRLRMLAIIIGGPLLLGTWMGLFFSDAPRRPVAIGFHTLTAVFLGFTVGALMLKFYQERSVTADAVYGAFCGYLLLGLTFGHIYSTIEWIKPGSFHGENASVTSKFVEEWHRHFLLIYFSFMTLTTVGYGDLTPAGDFARGVVVVEAISGQFYLAVLVAELIGRRVGQRSFHDSGGRDNAGS